MMRHPFGFLRHLVDFSFLKLDKAIKIAEEVTPNGCSRIEMPTYDERGMESIQRIGLGMYMDDPLTTANIGKVFVNQRPSINSNLWPQTAFSDSPHP